MTSASRGNAPGGHIVTGSQIQAGVIAYAHQAAEMQALLAGGDRNRFINGDMLVAQRATSFVGTPSGYKTLDRYGCTMDSGSGHTVGQVADGPAGFRYCFGVTIGTGAAPSAAHFNGLWQNIEGYNVADFMYGTANAAYAVLSFRVKASIAGNYSVGFMNAALNRYFLRTYTINAANTWETKTLILPGDTAGTWDYLNGTGLSVCWDLGSGSNYEAGPDAWGAAQKYRSSGNVQLVATSGATWRVTGLKFEPGLIATPFAPRHRALELALCQRYYQTISQVKLWASSATVSQAFGQSVTYPVRMRANPTVTVGGWTYGNSSGGTIEYAAVDALSIYAIPSSTAPAVLSANGITLSAEL